MFQYIKDVLLRECPRLASWCVSSSNFCVQDSHPTLLPRTHISKTATVTPITSLPQHGPEPLDETAVGRRLLAATLPGLRSRFSQRMRQMQPAKVFMAIRDMLHFDAWALDTFRFGGAGLSDLFKGEAVSSEMCRLGTP
jgi:hypothetical protein